MPDASLSNEGQLVVPSFKRGSEAHERGERSSKIGDANERPAMPDL